MRACFWGSRYNLSVGYRFGEVIRTFNLDYRIFGVVAVSFITLTRLITKTAARNPQPDSYHLLLGCLVVGEEVRLKKLNPKPQVLGFEAGRRESFGLKCTMVPYSNHAAKSVSAWNAFHMLYKIILTRAVPNASQLAKPPHLKVVTPTLIFSL